MEKGLGYGDGIWGAIWIIWEDGIQEQHEDYTELVYRGGVLCRSVQNGVEYYAETEYEAAMRVI